MLDIKFIKNNLDLVKDNIKKRFTKADADLAVKLYDDKNVIQVELDNLRQKRNENAGKMKGKLEQKDRDKLIEEGKELKNKIASLEEKQNEVSKKYIEEISKVPNMTHPTS